MAWFGTEVEQAKTTVETVTGVIYKQTGKVVTLLLNGVSIGNGQTGITIPTKYKPATDVYGIGFSLGVGSVAVRATSGGVIQVLTTTLGSYTSGTIFATLTYVLN